MKAALARIVTGGGERDTDAEAGAVGARGNASSSQQRLANAQRVISDPVSCLFWFVLSFSVPNGQLERFAPLERLEREMAVRQKARWEAATTRAVRLSRSRGAPLARIVARAEQRRDEAFSLVREGADRSMTAK